jgi:glycosyltransferase 2 family protein
MKFGWRGALGVLLSVGFLILAFRGIRFGEVVTLVRQADVGLLLLSVVVATCTFPLRARRWRPILDPVAPNLPFGKLFSATAIGMMLNNVLPARAGEPARAYALSRSTPSVSFPAAFASLAVDRLLDMIVMFGLMFLAMLDPAFPSGAEIMQRPVSSYAVGGLAVMIGLTAAMYAVVFFPTHVLSLYEMLARRIAPKLEEKGRVAVSAIIHGLSVLRQPSRFASVFAWTLAHWLCNALAFWIGFRAFGISVSFSAALFLQGLVAIGVAAPQMPGFFGVFELFSQVGLGLYGVRSDTAVAWAITYHALSFIPITLIGAWCFVRAGLSIGELGGAERSAAADADAEARRSATVPSES